MLYPEFCRISKNLSLRYAPIRKYAPTSCYQQITTSYRNPCNLNFCYDDPCCCCCCCCCCYDICCEPRYSSDYIPSSLNKYKKKGEEKGKYMKNRKKQEPNEIKEENLQLNEEEKKSNKSENINENNQKENSNENYEPNQSKEFMKKLKKSEPKIEDAKIDLGKNEDFNKEKDFRIFYSNEKGYLDKNDIKNGLNSIGINPSEQELNILMKRFDLQKNNFINYADFLDKVASIENNLGQKKENSPPKSVENSREKTINELKNLFELIIQSENNKNNDRCDNEKNNIELCCANIKAEYPKLLKKDIFF